MDKIVNFFRQPVFLLFMLLAVLIGLGLGYLFFGNPSASTAADDHQHDANGETWTCSMHPQIRQPEAGDCPICGMDLIPLEESTSNDPLVFEMSAEAVKLAQIETSVIGTASRSGKELTLSGKIAPDERLAASQVAHIPGRIEALYVSFAGEEVKKGQKLAKIYSPELVKAQQELLQALSLQDRHPELLEAARQKLAYWKIAPEKIAELEASESVQEFFTLTADVGGVVEKRRVAVGDYVRQGEVLFDLVNLSRVWVLFDAYEEDLAFVKKGDAIAFTTPALPGQTFSTRLTFIDPVIDPSTRTASLRAEVSNSRGQLKPAMFVEGKLTARAEPGESLLLPRSAVLWTGPRSVVYLREKGGKRPSFRFKEVMLGERVGENYVVIEGLQAGDEVVSQGSFTLDAAAQLNNQQSMINRLLERQEAASEEKEGDFRSQSPEAFKQQLYQLALGYLSLKDALVQTEPGEAKEAAALFLDKLSAMESDPLSGEALSFWQTQAEALKSHARQIAGSEEVEAQRKQFSFLSASLIESVKKLGIQGDTLYVQHCPMALDWEGADWLSERQAIRNPYFGDKMLKCGNVETQIVGD